MNYEFAHDAWQVGPGSEPTLDRSIHIDDVTMYQLPALIQEQP